MSGKRVSASEMLGARRTSHRHLERSESEALDHRGDSTSSLLEAPTLHQTYERITVYLRPGQRVWLEEVLDQKVRDAKGKRIKSISGSDIIRLAISRLQGAVEEEDFPFLQELILAAKHDAETFAGRKNRGLPK